MSKLKKRLRKKYHVGEFQEFGFEISATFQNYLSATEIDKIFDAFINEIEANELLFGGVSSHQTIKGFVTATKKYQSPTDAQRVKIKNWFESQPGIAECKVGNFINAWYDK